MLRQLPFIAGIIAVSMSTCWGDPLLDAVREGKVEQVRTLLESGVDPNENFTEGDSPLFIVSDPGIADLLFSHGAQPNIRHGTSLQTPLEYVAENYFNDEKHETLARKWKLIVARFRAAGAEYTINTAIYMNDAEFFKQKLAKDASWVNKTGGTRDVPLRLAARCGRVTICKLLLKYKANPDGDGKEHGFPVIVDAINHPAVLKVLVDNKVDLKRRITFMGNRSGFWPIGDKATPLHYAAKHGNLESIKLLIAAGVNPYETDEEGQAPLEIAVYYERFLSRSKSDRQRYMKTMSFLLEQRAADPEKTKTRESALNLARLLKSHRDIIELLEKKRSTP